MHLYCSTEKRRVVHLRGTFLGNNGHDTYWALDCCFMREFGKFNSLLNTEFASWKLHSMWRNVHSLGGWVVVVACREGGRCLTVVSNDVRDCGAL